MTINVVLVVEVFELILVFFVMYFSRIVLRKHPQMTAEEIAELYPEKLYLKDNYWILTILQCVTIFGFLLFFAASPGIPKGQGKLDLRFMTLIPVGFGMFTIFEGIFALATNSYVMSSRIRWNLFFYDKNQEFRWVAILEITLVFLEIIIFIIAAKIFTP